MLFFQSGREYLNSCVNKTNILPVKRGVYLIECINKITSIVSGILNDDNIFIYFEFMEELHGEATESPETEYFDKCCYTQQYTDQIKKYSKKYIQELYLLRSMLIKHMSLGCPEDQLEKLNNQFGLIEHFAYTFILRYEKKEK